MGEGKRMRKTDSVCCSYNASLPKPLLMRPEVKTETYRYKIPKSVELYEFYMHAKNNQRVFSYHNQVNEYQNGKFPSPDDVSYMNLFINGVLQPAKNYEVVKDKLILKTIDLPLENTILILQMVKVQYLIKMLLQGETPLEKI